MWNAWKCKCGSRGVLSSPSPGRAGSRADPTHAPPTVLLPKSTPDRVATPGLPYTPRLRPWLAGQGPRPGTTGSSRGLGVDGRTGGNATAPLPCTPPSPKAPSGMDTTDDVCPNPGGILPETEGRNALRIRQVTGMGSRAGGRSGFPGHTTQRPAPKSPGHPNPGGGGIPCGSRSERIDYPSPIPAAHHTVSRPPPYPPPHPSR